MDGRVERWRDHAEAVEGAEVEARFADGGPALARCGNRSIPCGWPDTALLDAVVSRMAGRAGLDVVALPDGIRLRRRGKLTMAFNYGEAPWPLPRGAELRVGPRVLVEGDVAIC